MRRVVGTLYEPNVWTVGVILATGVVIMARHPIARLLGTEVPVTPAVTTPAPIRHEATAAPALTLPVVAAPTHAPRDPFRVLVTSGGKVLAPVAATPTASRPAAVTPATPTSTATSCTGGTHRVVAGDTLWTIAARTVRSSDTDRVTLAWHRLYAANRSVIGANPAILQVGDSLCLPQSM